MTAARSTPAEVDVPPTQALLMDGACGPDPDEISAAMRAGLNTLFGFAAAHGILAAGPPRAIYTAYGPGGVRFTLAVPVSSAGPSEMAGAVRLASLPGVRALRFTHVGPYERLAAAYGEITSWLKQNGRMESDSDWQRYMPMWEEYVTDPEEAPAQQLVTHIYLPLDG